MRHYLLFAIMLLVWCNAGQAAAEDSSKPAAGASQDAAQKDAAPAIQSVLNSDGIYELPSLFFQESERGAIERARTEYLESVKVETEDDLLSQLQGIKQATKKTVDEPQETVYPQFYLETIMYRSNNDWTVWVKDTTGSIKLVPADIEKQDKPIKVIAIAKEEATLEWTPRNWGAVMRTYRPGTEHVSLDPDRRVVTFTLRVNQTMTSGDMMVKEGVVAPTQVENSAKPLPAGAAGDKKAQADPMTKGEASKTVLDLYGDLEPAKKP